MTGRPLVITGALYVDMGQQARGGDRWVRPPRARYECLLCRTVDGPVIGAEDVIAFVASAQTSHRDICTANREGVQAA
ncbi:hypothetical protein ACF082_29985 [Streptomyces lydicus]|uniref:hypothetical protein n=1 Tax=Streptomyces lydicus TaxID=47763 RepID=UPI0036F62C17